MRSFIFGLDEQFRPMEGGGGGAGTVSLPGYAQDIHEEWIEGGTNSPFKASGSYNLELVTKIAAQSNPYSGYSYTNPATLLSSLNSSVGSLSTAVGLLGPQSDWIGFLSAAGSQAAAKIGDIGTSGYYSGAQSRANTVLANIITQAAGTSGKYPVVASTFWGAMADTINSKLTSLGYVPSTTAATHLTSAITNIGTVMSDAKSEVSGLAYDPETDYAGFLAQAISSIYAGDPNFTVFDEVDLASTITGAVTSATTYVDALMLNVTETLTNTTEFDTFATAVKNKVDAAGFLPVFDPTTILAAADNDADTWLTTYISNKGLHGITNETSDVTGMLANMQADAAADLTDLSSASMMTAATSPGDTLHDTLFNAIINPITSTTQMNTAFDTAITKVDTAGKFPDADISTNQHSTALSNVVTAFAAVKGSTTDSPVAANTDWAAMLGRALTYATTNNPDVNVATTISGTDTAVGTLYGTAIGLIDTGITREVDLASMIDNAVAEADAAGVLTSLTAASLYDTATTDTTGSHTALEALAASSLNISTVLAGLAGAAFTKADSELADITPANEGTAGQGTVTSTNAALELLISSDITVATILAALAGDAKTKADSLGMLTSIDAGTAAGDAVDSVEVEMTELNALISSDIDEATDIAALLASALSYANTNAGTVAVGTEASSAETAAESALNDALGAVDNTEFLDSTLWPAYVAAAIDKADLAGTLNAVDVATIMTAARADAVSMLEGAVAAATDNEIDPEAIWLDIVNDAVAKADTVGVLVDLAITDAKADARTEKTALLAEIIAAVDAGFSEDDLGDIIDEAVAKADEAGVLSSITVTSLATAALAGAGTDLSAALSALNTGITESIDWEAVVTAAIAKVDTAGVLTNIDISAIVAAASSGADDEIDAAVTAALAAVDNSVISDIVADHAAQLEIDKDAAIRRYSSSMVGTNATQTSAYLFGLAIIESQKLQAISSFESQLKGQVFQQAMSLHVDAYKTELGIRLQEAITEKASREQFINSFFQGRLTVKGLDLDYKKAQLSYHASVYAQRFQTEFQNAVQAKLSREQFMEAYTQGKITLTDLRIRAEELQIRDRLDAWSQLLQAELAAAGQNKQSREQFMAQFEQGRLAMTSLARQFEMQQMQLYAQAYANMADARFSIASREESAREAFIQWHANGRANMAALREDYEKAQLGFYNGIFSQRFVQGTQIALSDKARRDQMFRDYLQEHLSLLGVRKGDEAEQRRVIFQSFLAELQAHMQEQMGNKESRERFIQEETQRALGLYSLNVQDEGQQRANITQKFLAAFQAEMQGALANKGAREAFAQEESQRHLALYDMFYRDTASKRGLVGQEFGAAVQGQLAAAGQNKEARENMIRAVLAGEQQMLSEAQTEERTRIGLYSALYAEQLRGRLDGAFRNKESKIGSLLQNASGEAGVYQMQVQDKLGRMREYGDEYRARLAAAVQEEMQNKTSREQAIFQHASGQNQLEALKAEYERQRFQFQLSTFQEALRAELTAKTTNKESDERWALQGTNAILDYVKARLQYEQTILSINSQDTRAALGARLQPNLDQQEQRTRTMADQFRALTQMHATRADYNMAQLRAMLQLRQDTIQTELQEQSVNKDSRERHADEAVRAMTQLRLANLDVERALYTSMPNWVQQERQHLSDFDNSRADMKTRFLAQHGAAIQQQEMARMEFDRTLTGIYADIFGKEFEAQLRSEIAVDDNRARLIADGTNVMMSAYNALMGHRFNYHSALSDFTALNLGVNTEYEKNTLEVDRLDALWELEVSNAAIPILSSPLTGASYVPDRPNRAANITGGALKGAGVGSEFGVAGAGVGALLGGIGGAFS